MTDVAEERFRALDRALRDLYVLSDREGFPSRLLAAVGPLIPSEVACYTELVPSARRVRNVADKPSEQLEALLPVLAEFQLQHPRIADFVQHGEQRALATSDYLSRREWHRRDLFQHFYGAMGLEEQLAIMMPAGPDVHLGLVFNRTSRSFTGDERAILDMLRPHVALAYANAEAVTGLRGGGSDSLVEIDTGRRGLVRLRRDGSACFATPNAVAMLRRCFAGGVGDGTLPPEVQGWIRAEAGKQRPAAAMVRRVLHVRRPGGGITLRLLSDANAERWLLVVEDASAAADAVTSLPPRLRRLLERLLAGCSEKEIAANTALSQHTIHEYVKQLYRRLGVGSRAQLMARFVDRRRGSR